MRKALVVLLACCSAIVGQGAALAGLAEKDGVPAHELYSWPNPQGGWNFCLLPTTNREKTVQEVFNPQTTLHGIDELKTELSKLPRRSDLVWFDRLTWNGAKISGSERLRYPPREIVVEVKHYAEIRGMKLIGPLRAESGTDNSGKPGAGKRRE